jgi:ABC-type lipoprotein release transport system permease subunit
MKPFFYLASFAIRGLVRRKVKNVSIFVLFGLIVYLFSGIDMMMNALHTQALKALEVQPEIIVQNLKAGRQLPIPVADARKIRKIIGVSKVVPRVWGNYFDRYTNANYTVVGVSKGEMEAGSVKEALSLSRLTHWPLRAREVLMGEGVLKARYLSMGGRLQLERPDGSPINFVVAGTFRSDVSLWTHDTIVMTNGDARDLFDMDATQAWDLAVYVPNPIEVAKVGEKIANVLPGARLVAKQQLVRTYGTSYGFRSGLMITVSLACLLAFLILAYDRAAGLSREEQMEIAILKALGWETRDVIQMTMLQSLVLSLTGFLVGFLTAYVSVFVLGAPVLRIALTGWSVLYPPHPIPPVLDVSKVFGLMFLTVIPYISVGIVPVWRSCTIDPEVVFRR